MLFRLLVPMLATGALALACGPRSHPDPSTPNAALAMRVQAEEAAARRRAATIAERAKHDGEVAPAFAVASTASGVRFELAVANAGNKAVEVSFPDGQTHDIVVVDERGREVWRWADGRLFTQARRNAIIAGGDTLRVEERWDAPKPPGKYVAVATLRSSNYPVQQRAEFIVQ